MSLKRTIILTVGILIYGVGFSQKAIAQNSSVLHSESVLFDMQFIMSNETFTLQKFEQKEDENTIYSCIFESPSALWVIRYCNGTKEKPWYLILAGSFLIKDTNTHLEYYLERESHIYRNIEYGSLAFTKSLPLMRVHIVNGDSQVNVDWPRKRLPFFQTLARVQEKFIEQALFEKPSDNLTEQTLAQLEVLQKWEQEQNKLNNEASESAVPVTATEETEQNKASDEFSTIMNIIENEKFTLDRVYYDGFQDTIRNCVFKSPSAVWVINYCEDIGGKLLEASWYNLLAGDFSITNTEINMDYYIEMKGRYNIYIEAEKENVSFIEKMSLRWVVFNLRNSTKINMTDEIISSKNLSFLRTLALIQRLYIEQSL